MSMWLGDYAEDYATLNFKFTTVTTTGAPTQLAGTPAISVYKANDLTQSTAGVTLTVDFDGVTGMNNVLIDLSADAFYATGQDYQVVITTGTVGGTSVVGYVVATFSIENRFTEVDAVSISGSAATADRLEAWLGGFLTGTVEEGGGPTTTVFQTDAAEATDDHFNNAIIVFTGGILLGQARRISDYTGATGTMTVEPPLTEAPSAADTWIIFPMVIGGIDSNGRVNIGSWLDQAVTLSAGNKPDVNTASEDNIDFGATKKASINAEVLDVLNTDTFAEPGQEAPAATNTLAVKIGYLFKFLRNEIRTTATQISVYDDAGSTVDHKSTISDDGTTFTRGEYGTGP